MLIPEVSIIIPFKNTSKFLPECLNSILAQSYTNWELIIVDDHSNDDSYARVDEFASSDTRIILLKNKGSGIIPALRLGLKHSNGRLITRMDSDDIMHPEKIQTLVDNIKREGKRKIALGLVSYFNENGLKEGYKKYEIWLNGLTRKGSNYSEIYKECVIPSPCWMMYKDDLLACGGFDSDRYPEDYDLAFRCYENQLECIPCDKNLHFWRDYDARTSHTDTNYSDNRFIDLKLFYFLKIDWDTTRPLVIWGAGKKGKQLAKLLLYKNIPFTWICDNPKKIGKHIYDKELYNFSHLKSLSRPQSIISVANNDSQKEIRTYFDKNQMKPMLDYFFFC